MSSRESPRNRRYAHGLARVDLLGGRYNMFGARRFESINTCFGTNRQSELSQSITFLPSSQCRILHPVQTPCDANAILSPLYPYFSVLPVFFTFPLTLSTNLTTLQSAIPLLFPNPFFPVATCSNQLDILTP